MYAKLLPVLALAATSACMSDDVLEGGVSAGRYSSSEATEVLEAFVDLYSEDGVEVVTTGRYVMEGALTFGTSAMEENEVAIGRLDFELDFSTDMSSGTAGAFAVYRVDEEATVTFEAGDVVYLRPIDGTLDLSGYAFGGDLGGSISGIISDEGSAYFLDGAYIGNVVEYDGETFAVAFIGSVSEGPMFDRLMEVESVDFVGAFIAKQF